MEPDVLKRNVALWVRDDGAVAVAALIVAWRPDGIPAAVACRALGVSRPWFYKHKDGAVPPRARRQGPAQSRGRAPVHGACGEVRAAAHHRMWLGRASYFGELSVLCA
jgi:hypothetical protein